MSRKEDQLVLERNRRLCAKYPTLPPGSFSYEELGREFSMTPQNVYRALSSAGLVSRDDRKTRSNQALNGKTISPFHVRLGQEVQRHYNEENLTRQILEKTTLSTVAYKLGMSTFALSKLIAGTYNPTLTQLGNIATWMRIPLSEVISRVEKPAKSFVVPRASSG